MVVATSIDAEIIYSVDEFAEFQIDFKLILWATWSDESVKFVHVCSEGVEMAG